MNFLQSQFCWIILDMNKMVEALIKRRDREGIPDSGDFLDKLRMLICRIEDAGGSLHGVNKTMTLTQGSLFFFAGFETTASTLTMALYFMAKHQDEQEQCFRDICSNMGEEGDINFQTVKDMKYLEAVILETLRLTPVLYRTQRLCLKDTEIKGEE